MKEAKLDIEITERGLVKLNAHIILKNTCDQDTQIAPFFQIQRTTPPTFCVYDLIRKTIYLQYPLTDPETKDSVKEVIKALISCGTYQLVANYKATFCVAETTKEKWAYLDPIELDNPLGSDAVEMLKNDLAFLDALP